MSIGSITSVQPIKSATLLAQFQHIVVPISSALNWLSIEYLTAFLTSVIDPLVKMQISSFKSGLGFSLGFSNPKWVVVGWNNCTTSVWRKRYKERIHMIHIAGHRNPYHWSLGIVK